jgi:Matrixin
MLSRFACSFIFIITLPFASADAYEIRGWDWSYQAHPIEKEFIICKTGAPVNAVQRIKEAADKWSSTKLKFKFGPDQCLADPSTTKPDGYSYISFTDFSDDGEMAVTEARPERIGSSRTVECDIRFNKKKAWYDGEGTPGAAQADLLSVAMHEFGHCIGLGDVASGEVVMNKKLDPGKTRRELTADDRAGRKRIYRD